MSRIQYDPPVQADVRCDNCNGEIQAVAHVVRGLQVRGLNEYEWTHVSSGSPECLPETRFARPYDGWRATRLIEEAVRARRAANDAALADDDGEPVAERGYVSPAVDALRNKLHGEGS